MGGEGELAAGLEKQKLGFDSRPGFSSFTKVGKERENEKFDKCKTPVNFMFFFINTSWHVLNLQQYRYNVFFYKFMYKKGNVVHGFLSNMHCM